MHRLAHPLARRWILLLGLLLGLCSLPAGLVIDDYVLRMHLEQRWLLPDPHPVLSLFSFVPGEAAGRQLMIDQGILPWWTHPELHLSFFRPLSALTHALDDALWRDRIWLQHLHSVAWWMLCLVTVGGLLRQVLGRGAVAALALLLFAVEDAHAWPIWWLSNRNALVTLSLGALAAWMYVRWRQGGAGRDLAGCLLTFTGALLGGESGIGAAAWMGAWELTMAREPWLKRARALAPVILVILAWRLCYTAMGYAAHGSGLYIDPGADPLRYLSELSERLPILALGQWAQAPVDVFAFAPEGLRLALQVGGLLTLAGVGLWLRPALQQRAEARFFALSFLLALLPVCATFTMARLLTFASASAAALIALRAEQGGLLGDRDASNTNNNLVTSVMLVLHGPVAALLLLVQILGVPFAFEWVVREGVRQVQREVAPELLVVVNGDSLITSYLLLHPEMRTPPARIALLAPAGSTVDVARTGERTLTLTVPEGWLWAPKDQLLRDPGLPFQVGERVRLPDYTAEVLETLPDGQPRTVRFEFARPLDDPRWQIVAFDGSKLAPFSLAPGERRSLAGMVR